MKLVCPGQIFWANLIDVCDQGQSNLDASLYEQLLILLRKNGEKKLYAKTH